MNDTVLFLGAGFSKASGLPTTNEIAQTFPSLEPTEATSSQIVQDYISSQIQDFWRYVFSWDGGDNAPSLEDHFTVIDLAANTGHNLGRYTPHQLRAIRRLSIHRIFDILDRTLVPNLAAAEFLTTASKGSGNALVTTNWDTAAEHYLTSDRQCAYSYGFTAHYVYSGNAPHEGIPILKLHGSSNWMYCDACRRIYVGQPGGGKTALHSWTYLREEDQDVLLGTRVGLQDSQQRSRFSCTYCGVDLSARVATFSFKKGLGFFQFQSVLDKALEAMRGARSWIFIGYSLPQADYEIRSLIKTAQMSDYARGSRDITAVVGHDTYAARRYECFFGSACEVVEKDLDEWWTESTV